MFNKSSFYGHYEEMTYGGALSFMRYKYTKELKSVDIAVSGLPFDAATSFRLGTKAIREASVQLSELLAFPDGIDPFNTLAIIDYGDCPLDCDYLSEVVN